MQRGGKGARGGCGGTHQHVAEVKGVHVWVEEGAPQRAPLRRESEGNQSNTGEAADGAWSSKCTLVLDEGSTRARVCARTGVRAGRGLSVSPSLDTDSPRSSSFARLLPRRSVPSSSRYTD